MLFDEVWALPRVGRYPVATLAIIQEDGRAAWGLGEGDWDHATRDLVFGFAMMFSDRFNGQALGIAIAVPGPPPVNLQGQRMSITSIDTFQVRIEPQGPKGTHTIHVQRLADGISHTIDATLDAVTQTYEGAAPGIGAAGSAHFILTFHGLDPS